MDFDARTNPGTKNGRGMRNNGTNCRNAYDNPWHIYKNRKNLDRCPNQVWKAHLRIPRHSRALISGAMGNFSSRWLAVQLDFQCR